MMLRVLNSKAANEKAHHGSAVWRLGNQQSTFPSQGSINFWHLTCLAAHSLWFFYFCIILKVQSSQGFCFHHKYYKERAVWGEEDMAQVICKEPKRLPQPLANSRLPARGLHTTNSGTSSWVRSREKYLLVLLTGKASWMLTHCWAKQLLQ